MCNQASDLGNLQVAAVFGMNLKSGLEDEDGVFGAVRALTNLEN